MSQQLSKVYQPDEIERQATEIWNSRPYFHAEPTDKNTYTIVIPPPNVTAALHLGHALNNTLQDILIRYHRMSGDETLWMPGTDHAGIATQTVVEKRILAEEGRKRTDFERDEFVKRIQEWKDEYEARIIEQLKAMGCSCDWQRTRFTMDEVCAKAVRTNFFNLFRDGLIYRGKRLVNWDPATQTVLADDEVEHETVQGYFWYMKYPLAQPVEFEGEKIETVTVATTRPETMLGDTAVAMNPADPRAKVLKGKQVRLPIAGRMIPIICDEHVVLPDPESEDEQAKFSTGFLKVTPAHDPDDWEIGLRNELDVINIMAPDGTISDKHGWGDCDTPEAQELLGLDRFEAREAIVEWFRQEGLLEDVRDYSHEVGHSYRSHVPIEPYLSDQWYIAVKKPIPHLADKFGDDMVDGTDIPKNSLAGLALQPLMDGRLKFTPDRYTKTYQSWLENLRDWPISRQLWWGHRIPVWAKVLEKGEKLDDKISGRYIEQADNSVDGDYKTKDKYADRIMVKERVFEDTGEHTVYICLLADDEQIISDIEAAGFQRDTDVLDTWFSSALWPFSTLGWPDETDELESFYPGDVLCTAREIITLWVSRMVMMGQYCVGDIPFQDVYIHAMLQDGQGRKMSKSLGNGIDPLIVINSHGADAMRFTLADMTTDTQDIRMPVTEMELPDGRKVNTSPKFDIGRSFCNKLWNASRFAMMNLEGTDSSRFDAEKMDITDKWILSRLDKLVSEVTDQLDNFKFSEPLENIYKFFWNDFCDWYLEWSKPRMQNEQEKPVAQNVLGFVLDQCLRLLHPFVPFITEGIFQKLNEIAPDRKLAGIAEPNTAEVLAVSGWAGLDKSLRDEKVEKAVEDIQLVIKTLRDIRNKYGISPKDKMSASSNAPDSVGQILNENSSLICQLANLEKFEASGDMEKPKKAAASVAGELQVYLHNAIDPQAEIKRLNKQKEKILKGKKSAEGKLSNENFLNKAKPEVVQRAKEQLEQFNRQLENVEQLLSELQD